jgi:hypothetical protein
MTGRWLPVSFRENKVEPKYFFLPKAHNQLYAQGSGTVRLVTAKTPPEPCAYNPLHYAEFRIMPICFPTNSPSLNSPNSIQPQSV